MTYQIYLVEDHPVVRRGLASLIEPEPGLTISGETGSAKEARNDLFEAEPDLVVLDLSLEEGSGLSLLEHLHNTRPDLPVLVVSMHDEVLYARRALDAGARGYLMKSNADTQVVDAIRRLLNRNVHLRSQLPSTLLYQHLWGGLPDCRSPLPRSGARHR